MSKLHPHVATDYESKAAAEGRLKAIVLPLTGGWVSGDPRGWPTEGLESGVEVGDRIYLAEKWCKGDWGSAFDDDIYFLESTTPEAENIGWQPPETMPPEAAEHWFAIAGVRACQMRNLTSDDAIANGMPQFSPERGGGYASQDQFFLCWNAAYPEQLWQGDRWVVVLTVEAIAL